MKLRFGEIEEILQIVHGIADDGRSQFRARLRNLSRVGLPLPSAGKGRKANYHPADLFKLAFAVELLQAGAPPEPATVSVAQYWPTLVEQLFAARQARQKGRVSSWFLVAEPHSLKGQLYRFKTETGEALARRLAAPTSIALPRLLIINAAAMLHGIERAAEQVGLDMAAFNASLDYDQAIVLKKGPRI